MASPTSAQKYLSTRGGSSGLSFEEVVLRGLAPDGGLFIPEGFPQLPTNWQHDWRDFSFEELAVHIFSLFISPDEISPEDLKAIVHKSYSTFRAPGVTPTIALDGNQKLYLLELFHGPTFAFKDVALQFLGNLFEYFLTRKNSGKEAEHREHLTVIGATSGDTGSAALYGLRDRKDVSIFVMFPTGKISPIQEAQMTTVSSPNTHCLSVDGTFDDCQDFLKALFADPVMNATQKVSSVNSVNFARILAQISYYFKSYFDLVRSGFNPSSDQIRFVVPTGNFGDVLAGYFAKRMGLPIGKLLIATNENDILYRFWHTGAYEKQPVHGREAAGGFADDGVKAHSSGVKETLAPAMDILVSSNFERLLWFLALEVYGSSNEDKQESKKIASGKVRQWQSDLKTKGGFAVEPEMLNAAKRDFGSERVSDEETVSTIRQVHQWPRPEGSSRQYVLDPHSAIGVAAALRSIKAQPGTYNVALATAHPAKFSNAVDLALSKEEGFHFADILPREFDGIESLPRRVTHVKKSEGVEGIRTLIIEKVEQELGRKIQ